jgi:hypothetical protein
MDRLKRNVMDNTNGCSYIIKTEQNNENEK